MASKDRMQWYEIYPSDGRPEAGIAHAVLSRNNPWLYYPTP